MAARFHNNNTRQNKGSEDTTQIPLLAELKVGFSNIKIKAEILEKYFDMHLVLAGHLLENW